MSKIENKTFLITGGLGFIGSNLALRLNDLNANVIVSSRNLDNLYRLSPKEDEIEVKKSDITIFSQVKEIVANTDVIFHLAAQTSHAYSMKNPQNDTEINVQGTLNLLESIKEVNEEVKLVFTSTKGVTGIPEKLPVDENTPSAPLDVYSINKLTAEEYCKVYQNHYGLDFTILRLTNIFGPRQQVTSPSLGILNFFIGQALKNKTITIYGDGNQLRDYNYVENTIDALLLCASEENAKNETFYLGSNIGTKFKDMAQTIIDVVGKGEMKFIPYPTDANKMEIGDFIVDYSKLNEKLNWKPKINFREGIELTVDFYKKHPEYLSK